MKPNNRVAVVMPPEWSSLIPSGLRLAMAKSGVHVVRDEPEAAFDLATAHLDTVFQVGVPAESMAVRYLNTRVRWWAE